jgi:hypothetical protein
MLRYEGKPYGSLYLHDRVFALGFGCLAGVLTRVLRDQALEPAEFIDRSRQALNAQIARNNMV